MSIGESAPVTPPARPSAPAIPTPLNGTHPEKPGRAPEPAPSPETVLELAAAPDPAAPADLDRARRLRERFAWYAGTVLLAALVVAAGFRIDQADFTAPFSYDGDVLLIMPMVKATLERGFGGHWRNERLGYPGIQELHDFPVIDHLHFAVLWLMGQVFTSYVTVYNLYFLLTWPLAALTAMAALRQLRLTLPAAAVGGLLFAFQPYHFMRGESHYFLSAYWVVPLSWLPALAVCRGAFPFFPREPDGARRFRPWRWASLWQVLLAAATASAGAYYAFFACALYGVAGVYGWVVHRTWRAAASAGVVAALVMAFGVLNHAPAFRYAAEHGRNSVTDRFPEEAEGYGLKIAHLLLPIDDHNLTALARLKSRYNTWRRPLNNENTCATLGAVGAAGLVILLVVLVLPVRRRWPYGPLASLTGFVLLFALIGGFGGVFNLLVFDQVRCYNRFSIYLAFTCLFAALWPLDRFLLTRTGWARWARYPVLGGVAVLGLVDQTPAAWFRETITETIQRDAERFRADARFFERVEEQMGPGAKVFTVPYIPYPEVPPIHAMNTYDQVRGYLHTGTLVWSYGAIKNRETDAWQRHVSYSGVEVLLERIVFRGFDGLFVDKRGFITTDRNQGDAVIDRVRRAAEWQGKVKLPMVVHEDGMQVLLDLRPYRDWLRSVDPVRFEQRSAEEREWPAVTWLRGFEESEPFGINDRFRWADRYAVAAIVNPADRTRRLMLGLTFGTDHPGVFHISVDGGGLKLIDGSERVPWADEIALEKPPGGWEMGRFGVTRQYLLEVPPGRHLFRFRCRVPEKFMPGDARDKCYFIRDISLVEMK